MSSHNRKQHAKRRLDDLICRSAPPLTNSHSPFWRLIHAVRASSSFLAPVSGSGRTNPQAAERVVHAVLRMASYWKAWQRTPEEWTAPDASPFVQFRSLVSHLFDDYPVPNFMASVWMSEHDSRWELNLYLHLAAGRSIRQFKLPVSFRLTKRAAAFFMQAPDDLVPMAAIRWSHVRSLGGSNHLARLLADKTVLGAPTEHEVFWESVIRFLVRNYPISDDEVVAIVQFVHQQRFQPAETAWGPGAGQQPLQPEFTLQGRTLMSLRRHMANWRTELLAKLPLPVASTPEWKKTDIKPFRSARKESLSMIDELLTDKELRVEGGIMRHCVATYSQDCARRRTSIWSLKIQEGERRKRLATIEVIPRTRTVWQIKGRANSPPNETALEVIQQWADREGLQIDEWA